MPLPRRLTREATESAERAQLEGGARTATLRAKTAGKVVGIPAEELDQEQLEQVASGHKRESS